MKKLLFTASKIINAIYNNNNEDCFKISINRDRFSLEINTYSRELNWDILEQIKTITDNPLVSYSILADSSQNLIIELRNE